MSELSELHVFNIPRADKGRWVAASRAAGGGLESWVIRTLNAAVNERFKTALDADLEQPTRAEVRAARLKAELTQTQAGELVHASLKTWQNWESEGAEGRKMPLAAWELFLIKTSQASS